MLQTLIRRGAIEPRLPFNVWTNPYKAKRTWPPDFSKLDNKHKFRLEKRYRRRSKLKWARPKWNKGVKLVQWGTILFVLVYGVLWMDVGEHGSPFDAIRRWFYDDSNPILPPRAAPVEANSPTAPREPQAQA